MIINERNLIIKAFARLDHFSENSLIKLFPEHFNCLILNLKLRIIK